MNVPVGPGVVIGPQILQRLVASDWGVRPVAARRAAVSTTASGAGAVPAAGGPDAADLVPGSGFFTARVEKVYRDGVVAYLRNEHRACVDRMTIVLASEHDVPSARLFAGFGAIAMGEPAIASTHLEAFLAGGNPLPDRLQVKYVPAAQIAIEVSIRVSDGITARVPFAEIAAVLALAQLDRDAGRFSEAVAILSQLDAVRPDPLIRLSLTDLLLAAGDNEGVVDRSTGVENDSDLAVELLRVRAHAFLALGLETAAQEAFRDALARTADRDPLLLRAVRYDRALAYEQGGQHARARADYERIVAADPGFEDVRERLAALR